MERAPSAERCRHSVGRGIQLDEDVADDLGRPVLARPVGGRQPDRLLDLRKAGARDRVHAYGRAILGEKAERHAVVRDDRPDDLRDEIEDVAHVEGLRERRREGLQPFVLPAPVLLVRGEALVLERHRDDVRDRPHELLILLGISPRLQAQKGQIAVARRAGERHAKHRPDLGVLEAPVAGKRRVEKGEEIVRASRARQHGPERVRIVFSRDEACVRAAVLVVQRRARDRVEGESRSPLVVGQGHRVEGEDARHRRGDALEDDVEIERLRRDAGDLRKHRDEGGRSRLHGAVILGPAVDYTSKVPVPGAVQDLAEGVLAGRTPAVARAITWAESGDSRFHTLLALVFPRTGGARVTGLTGSPGAGKSTLTAALARKARALGRKVGIVAVDPSSPFSGGAILGDRIRMQDLYTDPGVLIRSMATRGHLGGLARATADAVDVLDAAGYDEILVETVGVGQDEVEVFRLAESCVVVLTPGMGDDIQAIKAGLMEVADLFVVNKADRDGADRVVQEILQMLELGEHGAWVPPIVKTIATTGAGLDELAARLAEHRAFLDGPQGAQQAARADADAHRGTGEGRFS